VVALAVACLLLAHVPAARAQLSGGSGTALDSNWGVLRGTDVGYDPVRNIYLIVEAYGELRAFYVNSSGQALTPKVTLTNFGAWGSSMPRVQWGSGVNSGQGGFLVTWHANSGPGPAYPNGIHSAIITYNSNNTTANVGSYQLLSDYSQNGSYQEMGAPIAYSSTSGRFLVTWCTAGYGIQARVVDNNNSPVGGIITLEGNSSRDPSVTWNASTNEFGIGNTGWGNSGAFAAFRRMSASSLSVSNRTSFGFSNGTYVTGVDVNTSSHNYVMYWYTVGSMQVTAFDASGNQLGSGLAATAIVGTDNSAMAYGPGSGTFLLVGHGSTTGDVVGVELNGNGAPNSIAGAVTSGATLGSFYPRPAANSGAAQWNVSYARDLKVAFDQIVSTSSRNGGSNTALGGAPPTNGGGNNNGGSNTGCSTASPGSGWTCVNGGWLPPGYGGSTPTPDPNACTTPSPGAGYTCVAGQWVAPPPTNNTGCATASPGSGWTCVNGGWLPPGYGGGSPTPDPNACTTPSPGSGYTCVAGQWVAPPPPTGCSTASPGTGWTCVNGGWLPPGYSGTSSCSTPSPGAGWTCSNGGWLPPGYTGGSGGSGGSSNTCSTPDPFVSIGGGNCVNGGWVPKG
jgi:hypothetical protein